MHTVALSHIRFPFVTVRQEIYNGLKTYLFIQQGDFSISPTVGGCELGRLRSSSPSQGQLGLDEGDLS